MLTSFRATVVVGLAGAALATSGCGSDSPGDAVIETKSIADQAAQLGKGLVKAKEIEKFPVGSPERAFMAFWSAVQFSDQDAIINAYSPGIVAAVGRSELMDAARRVGTVYRTGTPVIQDKLQQSGATSIRYLAPSQEAAGKVAPNTISFKRFSGEWLIVYNSALDDELRLFRQADVQNSIDPTGRTGRDKSIAAGNAAARQQAKSFDEPSAERGKATPRATSPTTPDR